MFNLGAITNKNNKDDDRKWLYRMLIIGPSGSGKTNALLNLIHQDNDNLTDKIYLYAKDLSEPKYQFVIKKREDAGINNLNDSSEFIEYSNTMNVYNNIDDYNPISNISLVLITQSYFSVPKDVRLNSTYYLIMKITSKRELQQIAINHSADIDYKDFLKIYRNCKKEPYSFFTINTTLPGNNPLSFRKNFSDSPLTEKVKILDDKIKANQTQYDLHSKAAKTSALSSKELHKYEYLTGEDLGYKPDIIP